MVRPWKDERCKIQIESLDDAATIKSSNSRSTSPKEFSLEASLVVLKGCDFFKNCENPEKFSLSH